MVMERLDAARWLPENQDPTKQAAITQAREILTNAGVKDPGMLAVTSVEKQAVRTPKADSIVLAITEYRAKPLTPELVNATWRTLWKVWGVIAGQEFNVPSCDRTSEELAQLQKENKAVLLIPDNVDLVTLGKIFPQMGSLAVSEGTTIAEQSKGGSIDVEMNLNSPHGNTTETQAKDILESQGRDGQRLKTYIVGSQFSKLLTGHYFDENSRSRLPGSRDGGGMVDAGCHSDGGLFVSSHLAPQNHDPSMGFRSEGAKKT